MALGAVAGCSNPKKKAQKKLKQSVKKCRNAEGTFYTVEAFGDVKRKMLRSTCEEKVGEVKMPDQFSAQAQIGPYTWDIGLEKETGLWVLKDVRWATLDNARDRLQTDEPSESSLSRTVELLGKAQKQYGKSGWIRLRRLEAMLDLRSKKSGSGDIDPVKLGEQARTQFEETLEWARNNDDRDTEAEARLIVTDYLNSHLSSFQSAKRNLGGQDSWYENAIDQAEDKGNDEEADKYRKTLEKMREERPEKRKTYNTQIEAARVAICEHYTELAPSGIEDSTLKKRVISAEKSLDCATILGDASNGDDSSEGSSR